MSVAFLSRSSTHQSPVTIHYPLRPRRSTHDYLAYGEELTDPEFTTNNMKFTGHERDPETGLDYMLARYYTSGSGRFLQVDPVNDYNFTDPMSFNKYAYVRCNPIMGTDPTGMSLTSGQKARIHYLQTSGRSEELRNFVTDITVNIDASKKKDAQSTLTDLRNSGAWSGVDWHKVGKINRQVYQYATQNHYTYTTEMTGEEWANNEENLTRMENKFANVADVSTGLAVLTMGATLVIAKVCTWGEAGVAWEKASKFPTQANIENRDSKIAYAVVTTIPGGRIFVKNPVAKKILRLLDTKTSAILAAAKHGK